MTKFDKFGLADPLLRAITAEGYETPTPIQQQVIPAFLKGNDILGIAQTGTGKTAAFCLPILNHVLGAKRNLTPKTSTALIVAPTRELASQIVDNIRAYAKFSKVKVALVVGGVRSFGQVKAMRGGVDVIVATPGRLLDHMNTDAITLDNTQMVVLDEADQMMDLGFLPAIRKIMRSLPQERVTGLFSATMPKEIKSLACDFLSDPQEITVAAVSKPIERIAQSVRRVAKNEKRDVLTSLVLDESVERAVVFTRTKRGADRVCSHLKEAEMAAVAIHGDKSQAQRERALKQFKNGKNRVLVATDIAARGIDIDGVSHVFNFDLPEVSEAYVHRIGRTARAGRSGVAISLCDPSERHLLRAIEKLIGSKIANENGEIEEDVKPDREANDNKPRTKRSRNTRPFRQNAKGKSKPNAKINEFKQRGEKSSSKQNKPRLRSKRTGGKQRQRQAAA